MRRLTTTEARQVFDLPQIVLRVTEHALEHRRCACEATTMAPVPAGVGAPAQYGPGLRGLACYLLAAQHLPLARTVELLAELFGVTVSEGTLAAWYAAAAAALDSSRSMPLWPTNWPTPRCSAPMRPGPGSPGGWPGSTRCAPTG